MFKLVKNSEDMTQNHTKFHLSFIILATFRVIPTVNKE